MPETGGWLQVGGAPGIGVGKAEPNSSWIRSLCWRTVLLFTDSPGGEGPYWCWWQPLPSHLVTGLALAGWSFVLLRPRLEAELDFRSLQCSLLQAC